MSPPKGKKTKEPRCWGPKGNVLHCAKCRPSRPRCRWRRRENMCLCDAYHYPHRSGSGRCGKTDAMWEEIMRPRRRLG